MSVLKNIGDAVRCGNAPEAKRLVEQALAKDLKPWTILNGGMVPALNELGEKLKDYTISLPEVMVSVGAVRAGLSVLQPLLVEGIKERTGVAIIGTVQGDVHSLGKDLVKIMLEGNGFQVIDLGADVAAGRFIEAAVQHDTDIVAMSGLLTVSMLTMRETIESFEKAGVRKKVSILVGGGSLDAQSAKDIGADAYGEEASVAPEIALRLIKKSM